MKLLLRISILKKVGIELGQMPAWSISIDDLRVYADILDNPLIFLHFVEQRQNAIKSDLLQLNDEMDHLGLYLNHNHYSQYAKELAGENSKLMFHAYTMDIDSYFAAKMRNEAPPNPLHQEMPSRLYELVTFLARSKIAGRANIVGSILDLDGNWRKNIFDPIDGLLNEIRANKRTKALSSFGGDGTRVTLFCWCPPSVPQDHKMAVEHCHALMLLHGEANRLLLELWYSDDGKLMNVEGTWLKFEDIPNDQKKRLLEIAHNIKAARLYKAMSRRKIGRNEPCPCGSGKKYKRCCLR